ncbi:N-acetyltransferase [Hoeflea sp. WL0058]|uniref:N-acetyltransferase n=1 Tax=Flavimaribacter sediminis TaxID=2865987 RepID=A0AAE2ZSN8_9HYPH|nr:N-acetyltransferase [Flavimaribacter sediminis]MBW8639823.1 N-acetyltransferase [Flavimaribacter sediminis]
MQIRPEEPIDEPAVRAILLQCFPGPDEARLVDQLRSRGDAEIMLVALEDGKPVAFVALSRMRAPFKALGLAPVAVLPEYRNRGLAAELILRALADARSADWKGVFVLGDPEYYNRFGFSIEAAHGFKSPYAGPHFMALALDGDRLPATSGAVEYAPAFSNL